MKNFQNIYLSAIAIFALLISGCKSSNENENSTSETDTVIEKTDAQTVSASDSLSDYAVLKSKTLNLVQANEVEIAAFKAKLATETAANKIKFQTEIDSLLAKNTALKATLNSYKEQGKVQLKTFKERLQKSLNDINKDIETYRSEHK